MRGDRVDQTDHDHTRQRGMRKVGGTLRSLDLLQVPLEDTQHKFKIVGITSDSDVWPRICRPASY